MVSTTSFTSMILTEASPGASALNATLLGWSLLGTALRISGWSLTTDLRFSLLVIGYDFSAPTTAMRTSACSTFLSRSGRQGTALAGPLTIRVTRHQLIMMTAMMVVATMIFRALSLDSWMPIRFLRKK